MAISAENHAAPDEVIDLRKYFMVINRAKWRILLLAVLVSALTVFVVLNMKQIYSSKATLLIESQQAKAVKIDEVYGINSAQQEYYLTQFEILKSRTIAESVIDRLQLASHAEFVGQPGLLDDLRTLLPFLAAGTPQISAEGQAARDREKLVQAFIERLSIEPVRKTQLVSIVFEAQDPKLAAEVANAIGEAYIDGQLAAKMGITQKASTWLGGRLGELRLKLDQSEQSLQEFRLREGLVDVAGVRSLGSQELERLGEQITQARSKKAQIDGFVRVVKQYGIDQIEKLETLPEITAHPGVQSVKMEAVSAERKVSELSKIYGPKHPKLLAAKSELASVQDSLREQIRKLLSGITNEADTLSQNLSSLETEMQRAKGQYQDLSGKEAEYQRLQREVETNRQLFDTFMARQKETEVTGDFNSAVARFTDRAMPAVDPIKPKRKLIVILAFVAAIGFGIIVAFVMESLNDTIKTTQEVEAVLQQRALGVVPKIAGKQQLVTLNRTFFSTDARLFSESIRSIRTSLSLLGLERPMQVLAVTSSIPEEGKSTVSSNLSFACRQLETVLLIDADMRKPTIAKRFGLPAFQPGLANYLAETETLEDCIVHDEQSGIDIMPAGTIPLNPLELLSSPRVAALLTELRGRYQKIIIDTPPVHAVSDALVLSRLSDAVVMVVKADNTRSGLVQLSLSKLINAHARVVGVVLNDLDLKNAERYGSYGYYQYYAQSPEST
ncbi:polysaccharide biosynthesis tyrosine autokinase [Rheinheimera sp. F8]|uniref:GumC family protein n=1 Tax=Rheinheimera sp. F8 TaxID=1763998 RepID=UPI000744BBA1|nr:polysaccharide biosynthesis tyrosine autokinase [Rheinheimera sp. F8]ALZ77049.1 chain-length determining protein [Rheinheimera sp. F8]